MASWFQVVVATSTSGAILLGRLAPEYLYHHSTWQTGALLGLLQITIYTIYSWLIEPNYLSPLLKLPHPSGGSFFNGHFRTIIREPSGKPLKEWADTIPNDGLIHYKTAMNTPRVMPTSPKAMAEVLTTKSYDFIKPQRIRYNLERLLGVGILLAEGDEHKRQRKHLTPAFAFRHVKDLYPIFSSKAAEMMRAMHAKISAPTSDDTSSEKASPNNVVEVGEWSSRATLDIIGRAGMGQDFNALQDPSNELYQTYQLIFKPTGLARALGLLGFFFPPRLIGLIPIKRNDDMKRGSEVVRRVAYNLIQDKKSKLQKGESSDVDILSVALTSGGFTDENLVDQLMTFLAAGHETTATSMLWAILELAKDQEMQKRLRADLKASGFVSPLMSDSPSAQATAADLDRVPYLAAICNEVLRVHPPVAITLREAARDTSIVGVPIPKGTTVIISPTAVNTNKELWGEDANEFKPDRWMGPGRAGSGGASSNYAFMTFIHGPRSCIGAAFAKAEFMCLVAAWVAAFETVLEDPNKVIEIAGGVTQKPKGGVRVKLTPVLS